MSRTYSWMVLRNMAALFLLQGGNYIIPLLLIPFLIRVLGIEVFGTWMFVLSFVIIVRVCVNYGFDLTATRIVAVLHSHNKKDLAEVLFDVMTARFLIWFASTTLLTIVALSVSVLKPHVVLFLIGLATILGELLFPAWLFQGLDRMGPVVFFRLGSKIINICLVVFFVHGPEDLLLVPTIEAICTAIGGVSALLYAKWLFEIDWTRPSISRIRFLLKDGGTVFVANASVQLYTTLNMIMLGWIVGPAAVGAYALADKVYSAIRGLLAPFVQAIFPSMSRLYVTSKSDFQLVYQKILFRLLGVLACVGVATFVLAEQVILLISGAPEREAIVSLKVFAVSFPFALGGFLAPMLIVRLNGKVLMQITIFGGILGLVLCPPLVFLYGAPGAAAVFLGVQVYNSVALVVANRRS